MMEIRKGENSESEKFDEAWEVEELKALQAVLNVSRELYGGRIVFISYHSYGLRFFATL